MTKYIIPILAMAALPAYAQLDNTVEVTNEVQPVVKDADKINVFPNALDTPVKRANVQYMQQVQPLSQLAQDPLKDYSSEAVYKGNQRGYVHVGGGTRGQLDAKAACQFDLSDADALNLDLTFSGFNGNTLANDSYCSLHDPTRRMYKSRIAGKYDHLFDNGMDLFVKGGFENHHFNYMHSYDNDVTDKQHNRLADVSAGFDAWELGDFTLSAEVGAMIFKQKYPTWSEDKLRETILQGEVTGEYAFGVEHKAGLDIEFRKCGYSLDEVEGITHLHLAPHYIYSGDDFRLQLGMFVGSDGDMAPDASFAYHATPHSDFYIRAAGYERENDLRNLTAFNPYFVLSHGNAGFLEQEPMTLESEFHPIDVNVGYRFSNDAGTLAGDFNAGYDRAENALLFAPSQSALVSLVYPLVELGDKQRFYINADFMFAYKDRVKVDLKNQFNAWQYRQEGTEGDDWIKGSSIDPTLDLRWNVDVKIVDGLYAGLNWQIGYYDNPDADKLDNATPFVTYKRPTTNNLGLSVRYTIPANIPLSVFVKGNNLLNQKYDDYYSYRTLGASVLAGLAVSF